MKGTTANTSQFIPIHPKVMLSVNILLVLGLGFVFVDNFLLGGHFKAMLPSEPDSITLFTLLFTLPHILSGFISFADKEYLDFYRPKLFNGLRVAFVGSLVLTLISVQLAFLVFALYTMVHVFLQQSGISKSLMKGSNRSHTSWQWLGVAISAALYINVYSEYTLPWEPLIYGVAIASVLYTFLAVKAARASKTTIGSWYFWSTHLTPLLALVALVLGYPIITITVPRVIHDVTAYIMYVTHDHNRAIVSNGNRIYQTTSNIGLPVMLVNVVVSIGTAYALQSINQSNVIGIVLMTAFLFHYYSEGFVWKYGSIHRQHVVFR